MSSIQKNRRWDTVIVVSGPRDARERWACSVEWLVWPYRPRTEYSDWWECNAESLELLVARARDLGLTLEQQITVGGETALATLTDERTPANRQTEAPIIPRRRSPYGGKSEAR